MASNPTKALKSSLKATPAKSSTPAGVHVGLRIDRVDIVEFSLSAASETALEPVDCAFSISLEMTLDAAQKLVSIRVFVTVLTAENGQSSEPETVLGKLTTGIAFYIDNYEEAVVHKDNHATVLPGLAVTLNSIALSTARGSFSALFRGTHLDRAILPIIDPKLFQPVI